MVNPPARPGPRRAFLRSIAAAIAAAAAGTPACSADRSDGRIRASLWFAYGGKNREVLLSLIEQFHAEEPRYRIDATYQGDYFEALAKVRTAIAAGAAPALTHVVGEVVPYLAEAGAITPLDAFSGGEDFGLVPELAQEKAYLGGGSRPLWALPFNRSTPIAYFNRNVFRELGLQPPKTWEELRAVATAGMVRSGGEVKRWGFACPVDWWFWAALVGQAGGAVIDPDGTATLGGEAGVRAIELWQAMVREERTMKPPPGRDYNAWDAVNADFLSQRAAMIWTSTAYLRYLEENARFEVGAAPLPRDVRASVPVGGTMFVMPRGAPKDAQIAAFTFLRWMMRPAQANAWATRTGYIPISREGIAELTRSGHYAKHPNDRVAMDQLAFAAPWPWAKNLFRVQREAVQPRLEAAVLGGRDARATLEDARRAAMDP